MTALDTRMAYWSDKDESCESVLARYVLPPEIVFKEWYLSTANAAGSLFLKRQLNFPSVTLLTGSRAEALSLPEAVVLGEDGCFLDMTHPDSDSMFPVSNRFRSTSSGVVGDLVELEPVASADPRYYKLVPHAILRDLLRHRHPSYSGDYLPCRYYTVAAEESSATKAVSVHGPAVRVTDFSTCGHVIHDQDLVDAIRLDAWPAAIAAAWLGRPRPGGWPDSRLVHSLLDTPCCLTPTGQPGSADAPLEWRLSFSLPERRLAMSLTAEQRATYVLVKLLMKRSENGGSATFRSFYLKNILFWLCEAAEPAALPLWSQLPLQLHPSPGGCGVSALLECVERCASSGRLPSYFAPASNLLEHEPSDGLATVAEQARRLRGLGGLLGSLKLVTARCLFMSLGKIDYGPAWNWIDAAAAAMPAPPPPTAAKPAAATTPASLSSPPAHGGGKGGEGSQRLLTLLLAAYAALLKKVAASSCAAVRDDRRRSIPLRIMHSTVRRVTGRLIVDLYCRIRHDEFARLGDAYVLSVEVHSFRCFCRSAMEEYDIVDEDMLLLAQALLKLRLRGQHELSSGSFVPVTLKALRLITAESAMELPSAVAGILSGVASLEARNACQRASAGREAEDVEGSLNP